MPSATANSTQQSATQVSGYSPVPTNVLRLIDQVQIDLFVMPEGAEFPVLLRQAGYAIAKSQVDELVADKTKRVFVRDGDYNNFTKELLGSLDALVEDESIEPADRFSILQTAAAAEIEHACTLLKPNRYVSLSKKLGANLATLLESADLLPSELYRVARHDYATFSHVTNVGCYAGMLAEALGITDESDRREINVGAMLHDIGKRLIPRKILRKRGRLTPDERRIVENHPRSGYMELSQREDLSPAQLMMVYQHHERVDGDGYPVGVTEEEIHPWARLLAIVDVFDAITGERPYRAPVKPQEAVAYIESHAGAHFDKDMVRCFAKTMAVT